MDLRWLEFMERANKLPDGSVVALFNRHGHIITSSRPDVAQALFGNPANWSTAQGAIGSAEDVKNHSWTFATAPVVDRSVFVGFAMREWSLLAPTYVNVGADFIVPILLILFTWVTVWIVSERQLTRWIVYLRRISEAYRTGHYAIRPVLDGAPTEVSACSAKACRRWRRRSRNDELRNLREAVAQKTMLVREVHHRVKNNPADRDERSEPAGGPGARSGGDGGLAPERVRASTRSRWCIASHEIEDQNTIDLKRLITDLAEQTP